MGFSLSLMVVRHIERRLLLCMDRPSVSVSIKMMSF